MRSSSTKSKNTILLKLLTIFLFTFLPARVSQVFVSMSLLSVIYYLKDIPFTDKGKDDSKLIVLMGCSLDEEVMRLPRYTVHWFWSERFLNKKHYIREDYISLRDAIKDQKYFIRNYKGIIDILLVNTPVVLQLKLGLSHSNNRLIYKQSLLRLI